MKTGRQIDIKTRSDKEGWKAGQDGSGWQRQIFMDWREEIDQSHLNTIFYRGADSQ